MKRWIFWVVFIGLIVAASMWVVVAGRTYADGTSVEARPDHPAMPAQPAVVSKILAACPGLQRYRDDWQIGSVDEARGKVEIVMNDRLKEMPFDYYATGHHCYFEVSEDGHVSVPKRPCVSACLDTRSTVPRSTVIEIE